MALSVEEEKALLWQRNQRARIAFGRFLQSMLKAPKEPAERVEKNFAPLRRD
jgi:hypothetical protein